MMMGWMVMEGRVSLRMMRNTREDFVAMSNLDWEFGAYV